MLLHSFFHPLEINLTLSLFGTRCVKIVLIYSLYTHSQFIHTPDRIMPPSSSILSKEIRTTLKQAVTKHTSQYLKAESGTAGVAAPGLDVMRASLNAYLGDAAKHMLIAATKKRKHGDQGGKEGDDENDDVIPNINLKHAISFLETRCKTVVNPEDMEKLAKPKKKKAKKVAEVNGVHEKGKDGEKKKRSRKSKYIDAATLVNKDKKDRVEEAKEDKQDENEEKGDENEEDGNGPENGAEEEENGPEDEEEEGGEEEDEEGDKEDEEEVEEGGEEEGGGDEEEEDGEDEGDKMDIEEPKPKPRATRRSRK